MAVESHGSQACSENLSVLPRPLPGKVPNQHSPTFQPLTAAYRFVNKHNSSVTTQQQTRAHLGDYQGCHGWLSIWYPRISLVFNVLNKYLPGMLVPHRFSTNIYLSLQQLLGAHKCSSGTSQCSINVEYILDMGTHASGWDVASPWIV